MKLCEFADERFKQCCCMCKYRREATVCNCGGEWDEKLIIEKNEINDKHGLIGYACLVYTDQRQGPVTISKHKHSCGCECFEPWEKIE